MSAASLTPVELRAGRWYKREDHYALPCGVNGAKLRACQHLIGKGHAAGARTVISAASILSPQNAMAAAVAHQLGMRSHIILGATRPDSAIRQPSVQIATAMGAEFEYVPVGYNPYLQKAAAARAEAMGPEAYWLRYGITTPAGCSKADLAAFHQVGAEQTANLPDEIRTLVIPFGSGNTGTGVLVGLARRRPARLEQVVLVGIGPDRRDWMKERLATLGVQVPVPLVHIDLHGSGYARYGDKMPGQADGIVLHPTYEGKVVRYLDQHRPDWWVRRDATTCLWIVGGPLPKTKTKRERVK